jgi:adenine-specific DNA-methyltransferase
MAKQYKGSLTLEWFNKQKSIVSLDENSIKSETDIPAPRINWINKDEALFYELNQEEGKGKTPFWVNRDDIRVKESRPLVFQRAFKSVFLNDNKYDKKNQIISINEIKKEEEAYDIENVLIKGDNFLALNSLKKHLNKFTNSNKYKCVLIDPPYNTKKAFEKYDDNLEHSEWLTLMRDRLTVLYDLISDDGFIMVHIDDKENPYLQILLNEIFGRDNFVATFIWETDGNSDNQAKIIGIHEYIHVFAKDIQNLEYPSVFDPNLPPESKIFKDQIVNTIIKNGVKNPPSDVILPIGFPAQFEKGTIKKEDVAYPKYNKDLIIENFKLTNEVVGNSGWSSNAQLLEFIRNDFKPVKDTKGQSTIFSLKSTGAIESIKTRDKGYVTTVLRNMGNPQSTSKELKKLYNVDFDFPKPELLTSYLLEIFTDENDFVLDCFGGSGTTAAVSHKLKRKWITIEIGNHADTHIIPRLKGIINGIDNIGVSSKFNWKGGGSFKYYHLGESIIKRDKETGKGEFNWSLGKEFIQESLLVSYDFIIQKDIDVFPAQIFKDNNNPTVGKLLGKNSKAIYGLSFLVGPGDKDVSISNDEIKSIYNVIKKQEDFNALVIYTNKGIDIAQDAMPNDMDIVKVPHAIFAELER